MKTTLTRILAPALALSLGLGAALPASAHEAPRQETSRQMTKMGAAGAKQVHTQNRKGSGHLAKADDRKGCKGTRAMAKGKTHGARQGQDSHRGSGSDHHNPRNGRHG